MHTNTVLPDQPMLRRFYAFRLAEPDGQIP